MEALRKKAKELLENKTVQVVIGYEEGTAKRVRAAFVRDPNKTDKLVFDDRCVQNLTIYLSKHEVKKFGKPAIIANIGVLRSIVQLAAENQLKEENVLVLGVSEKGEVIDFPTFKSIAEYLSTRPTELSAEDKIKLEKIEKMPLEERWNYWQSQLAQCFKCYACRASCPLCYCSRCTVDCNQPQWIPVASHPIGNLEWHIMRAMHLAGRCVNCGECARACPLDIPMNLLTQKLCDDVFVNFGLRSGMSLELESALSVYKPNDKENFIK